jgi:hypothetical protein
VVLGLSVRFGGVSFMLGSFVVAANFVVNGLKRGVQVGVGN